MYVKSGHYNGDGTTPRTITIEFEPKIVIVCSSGNVSAYFRTDDFPDNESVRICGYLTSNATDCILSFTSTGFTVGDNIGVNAIGSSYDYIALGDDGSGDIFTLSYEGDGTDNRNITSGSMGFTPNMAFTCRTGVNDSYFAVWKSNDMAGELSVSAGGYSSTTNKIQSLIENGFQVGSNAEVNKNGNTFYAFCLKEGNNCKFGTYEGDGTDDRDITGVGINPDCVGVQRQSGTTGMVEHNQSGEDTLGDYSYEFPAGYAETNDIQDLITDGFQIGSGAAVNAAAGTTTYYYWAFLENIPEIDFSANKDNIQRHFFAVYMRENGTLIDTADYDTADHWVTFLANFLHIGFCALGGINLDIIPNSIVGDLGEEIVASYDGDLNIRFLQNTVTDYTAADDMTTKDCDMLLIDQVNNQFCYIHNKEFNIEKSVKSGEISEIKIMLKQRAAEHEGVYGFYYLIDEIPTS